MSKSLVLPRQSDYEIVIEEYDFRCVQAILDNLPITDYVLVDEAQPASTAP